MMHTLFKAGWEDQYLDLLKRCLLDGDLIENDRTGTGTTSLFGETIEVDLTTEFPLMTTKQIHWKSVVGELFWMLSGSTSDAELQEKYGVTIWKEWAVNGQLGPVYGAQWRRWDTMHGSVDQIAELIDNLCTKPYSRRHVVSAWNVEDLPVETLSPQQNVQDGRMALAPCHCLFQFRVRPNGLLDLVLYQRSCDIFLGVPFNLPSYALLCHIIANIVGLRPGKFTWVGGDVHLYSNHRAQAIEQLRRRPTHGPDVSVERPIGEVPRKFDSVEDLLATGPAAVKLEHYHPQGRISAPVAV